VNTPKSRIAYTVESTPGVSPGIAHRIVIDTLASYGLQSAKEYLKEL